jgi:AAA+ superfamily predicted ATPase
LSSADIETPRAVTSRRSGLRRGTGKTAPSLSRALGALDDVLALAIDRAAQVLGPGTLLDPWRGMHIDDADARRWLASEAPASTKEGIATRLARVARTVPTFKAAARIHRLTGIDLAILLIALAPDVDLKYERIYGYLQDDISRKRPAPDLIANLLAGGVDSRLTLLSRLEAGCPLVRAGVVALAATPDTPWLARSVVVDELWGNWLTGGKAIGSALSTCSRLLVPEIDGEIALDVHPRIRALIARSMEVPSPGRRRPCVWMHGPHGAGKFALANALASEHGLKLLAVDVRNFSSAVEVADKVQRADRAGTLFGALLYFHGVGELARRGAHLLREFTDVLSTVSAPHVVASLEAFRSLHGPPLDVVRVPMRFPTAAQRQRIWERALASCRTGAEPSALVRVATHFSLSAAQIGQAARDIATDASIESTGALAYCDLAAAARQQCGSELASLAQRVVPQASFDSLVTATEVQAQLREICTHVGARETVRAEWAPGSVHARRMGITALFVGPSGTGKTLAAEAVARELGIDMYRIDLASIVSKYIGETEKNLDRVFAAAEHANAVLFFDEADALFGKRSEVKDAHDRYANIEIAYLLQKMEQFDGLAILATNLQRNLDEAFARRLTFTVTFPFPEEAERQRLWEQLWPPRAPRANDVDFRWFAHEFRLSGGNIRNAIFAAAHLAAANGQTVTRGHLMHATRREFQKLGKALADPAAREARHSP